MKYNDDKNTHTHIVKQIDELLTAAKEGGGEK
jgi:hypothetical protein